MASSPARARAAEFSIDREGRWHHNGTPIGRESLLRMLASMLRRDERGYFLDTAEQRLRVEVADAPLLAVDLEVESTDSRRLWLITALGARHVVCARYPLRVRPDKVAGEWRLYQQLDGGLEALVHRNVFYRLAELAESEPGGERLGVCSDGEFYLLEP